MDFKCIDDIEKSYLSSTNKDKTFCEFKGTATYWTVTVDGKSLAKVGWSYQNPDKGSEMLKNHVAFYARNMDCYINDEKVKPQQGDFYGGWITSNIIGPFKGGPGTFGW